MNRRPATTILAAALALATGLTLAACSPATTHADPSTAPAHTATPTPTPTTPAIPTQKPIAAPTSISQAVVDANKAYEAFQVANLAWEKNLSLGTKYVSGYVLNPSPAWSSINDTQTMNKTNPVTSGGPFGWELNEPMSYAGPLTDVSTGKKYPYGTAILYGCLDNTKVTFSDAKVPKGTFPFEVVMVYAAERHVWLIRESNDLSHGNPGGKVPQC